MSVGVERVFVGGEGSVLGICYVNIGRKMTELCPFNVLPQKWHLVYFVPIDFKPSLKSIRPKLAILSPKNSKNSPKWPYLKPQFARVSFTKKPTRPTFFYEFVHKKFGLKSKIGLDQYVQNPYLSIYIDFERFRLVENRLIKRLGCRPSRTLGKCLIQDTVCQLVQLRWKYTSTSRTHASY